MSYQVLARVDYYVTYVISSLENRRWYRKGPSNSQEGRFEENTKSSMHKRVEWTKTGRLESSRVTMRLTVC
jgi:hypothetical protein